MQRRRFIGSLAAGAAVSAPFIGTAISRVDGRAKVTGAAKYAAESNQPGLAHAALVAATSSEKSGVSSGTNSSSGWPTRRARPTPKNCSAERLA